MIEGLWTVEVSSKIGAVLTNGVVVLFDGRILGGDTRYYYVGTYTLDDAGRANAVVMLTHYAGLPESIFGERQEFIINLYGRPERPAFDLESNDLAARLTYRAPIQLA